MINWYKLGYVCDSVDECDTLVEVTTRKQGLKEFKCPACGRRLNLISILDATKEMEEE